MSSVGRLIVAAATTALGLLATGGLAQTPGQPDQLPPGHPPIGAGGGARSGPKPGESSQGMFRPHPDIVRSQAALPMGTIEIFVYDADHKPLADASVTLGTKRNSIEKGESRSTKTGRTDKQGKLVFRGQKAGRITYRIMTSRGSATFRSAPFSLRNRGVHVELHTYEPTALADSAVVTEAFVSLEVKQDTLAVSHLVRALNLGRTAFVAKDLLLELPEGAKGFRQQDSEDGVSATRTESGHVKIAGTFPPGQREVAFNYRVPLDSSSTQQFDLPMPPRSVRSRVVVGAGSDMGLDVEGFPPASAGSNRDGKRVLQTVKQAEMSGGLAGLLKSNNASTVKLTLTGLPSRGIAPLLACVLAALMVALGGAHYQKARSQSGLRKDQREDLVEAREAMLDELVRLEKARKTGEVGPRSYERLRATMLDALARIVSTLENRNRPAVPEPKKRKGAA